MADPQLLALDLPTLDDVLTDVRLALTAEYAALDESAFDSASALYPLATAIGRLLFDLMLRAREYASQGTPFGATGANLDALLAAEQITVPTPATAVLTVAVTARNSYTLAVGARVASDGGEQYTTNHPVHFGASRETRKVQITAEDIGSAYNLELGTTATLEALDDDIEPRVTVVSVDNAGSDPADDSVKMDLLRAKKAQSNAAGTAANYRFKLAQLDAAIARVYSLESFPYNGCLTLFPLLRLDAATESGAPWTLRVPTAGQLSAWETALQQDTLRLVNDRIFVHAVVERQVRLQIVLIPDNADTRHSVLMALQAGFAEFYEIGGYTIPNSEISAMISGAAGEISHTLLDVDGLGADADAVAAVGTFLQVHPAITWS